VGRCFQLNDNPEAARKEFDAVVREEGDYADPAKRLVRYYRILLIAKDRTEKDPMKKVQVAAEDWLKSYSNWQNSPEGYGVRFTLAKAYQSQADKMQQPNKPPSAAASDFYAKAQKLYQGLEQSDTEYAEEARKGRLSIIFTVSAERSKGDIGKLKDFEECY